MSYHEEYTKKHVEHSLYAETVEKLRDECNRLLEKHPDKKLFIIYNDLYGNEVYYKEPRPEKDVKKDVKSRIDNISAELKWLKEQL